MTFDMPSAELSTITDYYEGYFDGGQKSIVLNLDLTDSETDVGNYAVTGSIDGQPVTIYHAAYAARQKATEAGTYAATLSLSSPIAGGPTSGVVPQPCRLTRKVEQSLRANCRTARISVHRGFWWAVPVEMNS